MPLGLNPRVTLLRESPTRRIDAIREELSRSGVDVILLSTGQPSIPPPRWLREWLAGKLLEETMRLYAYTPTAGIADLREAIVEDVKDYGGPELEPSQVVVTAGGQGAMFPALSAILEPGDEVVLFDPTYFGYQPIIEYLGAKVKWVPTGPGYQPDIDALNEAVVRGKTKAIVVVTPDNPTGRVIDEQTAKAIAEIAVDAGAWIVADEAYRTLVYEGSHVWIYKYAPENTIGVNAFSKDPGIPGWRLGFTYSERELARRIALVSQEIVYCPPSVAQYMVLEYLRNRELRRRHVEEVKKVYASRRDALLKAIDENLPKARYTKPSGGMFAMIDLREYLEPAGIDSEKLAERALREQRVATIPGSYFGPGQKYTLRLSFVTEPPERLREGVRRLARALEGLS